LPRNDTGSSKALALTVLAVTLLTASACDRKAKEVKGAAASPPPAVVVAMVEQRTVPIVRDFVARTEAIPTVDVRARVPGVLEKVLYKEGSEVKQGQVLFEIQRAEYSASLDSAKAQLAKANADLIRAKDTSVVDRTRAQLEQRKADLEKANRDVLRYQPLAEARAIPQQDLDTARSAEKVAAAGVDVAEAALKDSQLAQRTQIQLSEAAVESAKAAVTQADLNLGYTQVTAPISGIIGKIMVDPGNLVGKAEPTLLTTISAVDPIYAEFPVAEADYLKLAAQIRLDAQGRGRDTERRLQLFLADDTIFPEKGRFVFVGRGFDPKTGTKRWTYRLNTPSTEAGVLTTASDMLFSGARDGSFFALDARTGKLLWQTNLGPSVAAAPITYAVNGKQYVSIVAGNSMFTFGLRESAVPAPAAARP